MELRSLVNKDVVNRKRYNFFSVLKRRILLVKKIKNRVLGRPVIIPDPSRLEHKRQSKVQSTPDVQILPESTSTSGTKTQKSSRTSYRTRTRVPLTSLKVLLLLSVRFQKPRIWTLIVWQWIRRKITGLVQCSGRFCILLPFIWDPECNIFYIYKSHIFLIPRRRLYGMESDNHLKQW